MSTWASLMSFYANQKDLDELRVRQRQFRKGAYRRRREQGHVDRRQDERLAALENENDDLKLCLGTLLTVLQGRGHLDREEVAEILVPLLEPYVDEEGGA